MLIKELFTTMDNLIGDIATFKGLSFRFEHGILMVDIFETGDPVDKMFVCDFIYDEEDKEPVSFAAKGREELADQLAHYVLQ